jgi:hypothetical protein
MIAIPPDKQSDAPDESDAGHQKNSNVNIPTAVVLAVITAAVSIVGSYFAYRVQIRQLETQVSEREGKIEEIQANTNKLAENSIGPLEQGQKLCRVLQGKTWRDGVIVPQSWNINQCKDYMLKSGGNGYQLGCVYTDNTTLGGENGSTPSPNCRWK